MRSCHTPVAESREKGWRTAQEATAAVLTGRTER